MAEVETHTHELVGEKSLRKVIRRKAGCLQKIITVTDPILHQLLKSGALKEDGANALAKLQEKDRMAHLVEYLELAEEGGRSHFLNFIESQSPSLHEEIMVEIYAECGSLPIDDAEVEDASFLVHRHFGTSRRFSEQDKRVMTSLVATKAQVAKEVWSRRLSVSEHDLQALRREIDQYEKLIRSTNETIKMFIKRNEMGLLDFFESKSTSEILRASPKERKTEELLNELVRRTHFVLQRFSAILMDKHSLAEQKQECLAILKRQESPLPLHVLIHDTIRHLLKENESSSSQVKHLRHKAVNLEEQLNSRDLEVERLQDEIKQLRSRSQLGSWRESPVTGGVSSTVSMVRAKSLGSGLLVDDAAIDLGSDVNLTADSAVIPDSAVDAVDTVDSRPAGQTTAAATTTPPHGRRRQEVKGPMSQHQKPYCGHSLPPIPKTKNTAMWPSAKAGKAKQCLLDV